MGMGMWRACYSNIREFFFKHVRAVPRVFIALLEGYLPGSTDPDPRIRVKKRVRDLTGGLLGLLKRAQCRV